MGLTHERQTTKSSGHISQRRPQKQNFRHHLSRQWREASGQHYLVRQFLRSAAPGRPSATRLQARDLHSDAHGTGPAARARFRPRGRVTRGKSAKGGVASYEKRRAIVLHVAKKSGADPNRSEESRLEEAVALTAAIGLEVVEALIAPIARATPATLI